MGHDAGRNRFEIYQMVFALRTAIYAPNVWNSQLIN